MIDLRSDTVTRPTPAMLRAMMAAEVGDDVMAEDPTARRLEEVGAEFLGRPAALFFPTGTMANQVALRTWTQPGDEVIADRLSHCYRLECAAAAALSGLSFNPAATEDGILTPAHVTAALCGENIHHPVSRVVVMENTHNYHGGTCYTVAQARATAEAARGAGLAVHMDGARLANAAVAQQVKPADYGRLCDSVTQCLSKGLGCPVGTLLAGSAEFIRRARRYRKMFGGGMRQIGYLAAAGLYALEHHVERLAEDHARARRLAEGIAALPGMALRLDRVQTNIVFFRFTAGADRARQAVERLKAEGVLIGLPLADTARAVTHLDVTDADVDRALLALSRV